MRVEVMTVQEKKRKALERFTKRLLGSSVGDEVAKIVLFSSLVKGETNDFLEHLSPEVKDEALAEMTRVLKLGGHMIHIFPVDSQHFLMCWAKRFPDLYQRYFVILDGHEGLETARATLERFQRLGLRLVHLSIQKGVIWSKWEVLKRFNNKYRQTARWLGGLVRLACFLGHNRWINHGINPVLWALDRLLTPWFGLDYVYRVGMCLEKPK